MDLINVQEYEALAQARLDPGVWGFDSSGAEDEVTLRENRLRLSGFNCCRVCCAVSAGRTCARRCWEPWWACPCWWRQRPIRGWRARKASAQRHGQPEPLGR